MEIINLIVEQALVLIPVLYILGMFLKMSQLKDKYIPVVLLAIGIILAMMLLGFNVNAFIQGVLVTGAAVFTNQLTKQLAE